MSPMKSRAQRAYLWLHNPKVAKEFESGTPKGAKLPKHVKKKKVKSKTTKKKKR